MKIEKDKFASLSAVGRHLSGKATISLFSIWLKLKDDELINNY